MAEFTPHEKRVFDLPFQEKIEGPEADALRKIVDHFPFVLDVAECQFDRDVAAAGLTAMLAHSEFERAKTNWYAKAKKARQEKLNAESPV